MEETKKEDKVKGAQCRGMNESWWGSGKRPDRSRFIMIYDCNIIMLVSFPEHQGFIVGTKKSQKTQSASHLSSLSLVSRRAKAWKLPKVLYP